MTRRPRRLIRSVLVGTIAGAMLSVGVASAASADQVRGMEYWLSAYGITQAWQTTKGAGVKVAVIDTGVDGSVPELRGAVVGGTDVSGIGSSNGQKPIGEDNAHGTWVASLLAGRGTGGDGGVIGVAPAASLLTISVALGTTNTPVSTDEQIAQAVRWAVDHGAKVINMSLTRNTLDWPPSWDDAFLYAFEHDVVIVAAAGNRGSGTNEVGAPATIPGVLTVGGVDRNGKASFDASSQGITIAVCAPSERLVGVNPGGGYVQWEGTSGAAPIVAGVVALVRAAHPNLDAGNVINRIIKTATPAGGTAPSPIYGYGLVNAAAAVTASVAPVTTSPANELSQWIALHRRAAGPTPSTAPPAVSIPVPTALPAQKRAGLPTAMLSNWALMTTVNIPLAVLIGLVAILALAVFAAFRHFGRIRRRG